MKLWKIFVVIVLCVVAIPAILIVLFFFTGGIFGDCAEDLVSRIASSDDQYEASLVTRNCGATTSLASHLNLSRVGFEDGELLFIIENLSPVGIEWQNPKLLKVIFSEKDSEAVFKKLGRWGDVRVIYEQVE